MLLPHGLKLIQIPRWGGAIVIIIITALQRKRKE